MGYGARHMALSGTEEIHGVNPSVLVIIPAYNEQATIGHVLESLREHAPDYDVLVIDDGSKDDTARIVRQYPNTILVRLPYNMGIGTTMQTGYLYAYRNGYDIAVQCDADGQHPVHQMDRIVGRVANGDADMVIGSRYVTDTEYVPGLLRRLGKSLLSRLVDSVVGGGITDTTSGFRAMNRKVLEVFTRYYPDDYPEAEAIVILARNGLKPIEVSVDMSQRQGGVSSINFSRAVYYLVKVSLAIFIGTFKRITGTRTEFWNDFPARKKAEPV